MKNDEKRKLKERLLLSRTYLELSSEAVEYCKVNAFIGSRRWFQYYGLYCSGKELIAQLSVVRTKELETVLNYLGEASKDLGVCLKEVPIEVSSIMYGQNLIDNMRLNIARELPEELTEEASRKM